MTCQKFCSVSGSKFIKQMFFIQEQGGHSVFHNAPLLFCLDFFTEFLAQALSWVSFLKLNLELVDRKIVTRLV
jgi:hypothetical protein